MLLSRRPLAAQRRREGRRQVRQAAALQGLLLPPRDPAGAWAVASVGCGTVPQDHRRASNRPRGVLTCLPAHAHLPAAAVYVPGRRLHCRQRHRRREHLRHQVCGRELHAQAHRARCIVPCSAGLQAYCCSSRCNVLLILLARRMLQASCRWPTPAPTPTARRCAVAAHWRAAAPPCMR